MRMMLLNLLLALLWLFLWGSFDAHSFAFGVVLGYLLLTAVGRVDPMAKQYSLRIWKLIRFVIYFIRILIIANLQVAQLIITPGAVFKPRIVRYYVGDLNAAQITTLGNAITLTPGTLTIDLSQDAQYLYIHCMAAENRDEAIQALDELRNRLIHEVFE